MLKNNPSTYPLAPLLSLTQGIHWSHQRLLAVASQLSMLVIGMIILTNLIITLGERRLQEEWATQRYSELQTIGTLITDKVSFQQFRTQIFANGELLKQYLSNPTTKQQLKLQESWQDLVKHIPELLSIALYDPQGNYKFSTPSNFSKDALPPTLLGASRNMGGKEVYTSPLEFVPIEGMLEPYMYQMAWLEKPDQSSMGYLVTYNSMVQMLEAIKPAFSSNKSPMLVLDTQGLLYAGASALAPLSNMPETLGASLRQTYPALWRDMSMSNFGQFHGEEATFVYLKVELTAQPETRREYFLLSYVRNADIAARFSQWQNIVIVASLILTVLAAWVVLLSHMYRLQQRSRQYSIDVANGLFNSDIGFMMVNENARVISANTKAAEATLVPLDELTDRNLQRTLCLDDKTYAELMEQVHKTGQWSGEISLESINGPTLRVHIRQAPRASRGSPHLLITLEDISELVSSKEQAFLSELLCDSTVATALTDANGKLIKINPVFDALMQLNGDLNQDLASLLANDLGNQWQRISAQIAMQGQWQGQILCSPKQAHSNCLQATLKGHVAADGEIDYIVCTLEQAAERGRGTEKRSLVPHRSTILLSLVDLERYFNSLPPPSRLSSSLLLMDINPEGMLSHMSDIDQLANRQQEVEVQLLLEIPANYQILHWQLGKLLVMLPDTDATQAHNFALNMMEKLNSNGLGEGISIGIAGYQEGQTLEQYLNNAEIALKRAKQNNDQNIGQAFTRHQS
ncbi:MAG: PAS domain-containing protein [Gammaproteobacteria bacterium]|nr:PAS domain-containing protein [uncultured Shewanella sp.]MBU1391858.1 PAS domain-containing protein [Gammaproteobacteria bacterium]MBU1476554.1 PAS domain-containing protein [Gammaproteobacteria bacterium]MBU2000074.1 PAS domain-containing protein [Gammaproteobacteria bacterium]MBU2133886.1 PAS domain-containing protein [Gammaproteobacteria bacterium]MBU2187637.1 PAS domain-containing protein [Gammaproteobacteria bacterium]